MKAVIMAGGFGSRLKPLTNDLPKPMVPIINKPIIHYIVELLKSYGINDIAMTLGYKPERIMDYFGDGSEFCCNIEYFVEKIPLGTAGSVKNTQKFIGNENFVVISGDAFTNIDLNEMYELHVASNQLATIAVKEVGDPSGFGVVKYSKDCIIRGFIEKPVFSIEKTVNTGIYIFKPEIFDYIPPAKYDFGKELFPRLIGKMTAYKTNAYWSDIGTLSSYYLTNAEVANHPSSFGVIL